MDFELKYNIKEREEDILADTMAMPFQPVKQFGTIKEGEWHNKLFFGDNLQALKYLKKLQDEGKLEKIKLIYIDPPFGTGDIYDKKGEPAYSSALQGPKFVEFLRKRLIFLREILADDGLIFVHLDNRMDSYIRIILDELLGPNNFLNEIIWYYPDKFQGNINRFADNHNMILLYSKTQNYIFNQIKISLGQKIKRPTRVWDKETQNLKVLRDKTGKILYKEYEEKWLDSVWQIPSRSVVVYGTNEYLGYPTQKPEELLKRIIECGSNPGDIVLDCFAGSGTTGAVAEKLGRRWIMVDSSKLAIYTIIKRLHNLKKEIGNKGEPLQPKPFVLYKA